MGKVAIRYVGALMDSSGYAAAGRGYVDSLLKTDQVDITVKLASFERQKTNHGEIGDKINQLVDRQLPYNIQIVHLTPDNFTSYREKGKYNIAYTVWETDRLPDRWVPLCNSMDEIWVPSQWNIEVFKQSGVKKPIFCIPHVVAIPDSAPGVLSQIGSDNTFVFYSIFQWLERKNPLCLLRAYLTEFRADENVALALKTYRLDTSEQECQVIRNDISTVKRSLRLNSYPPIVFFSQLMTSAQMKGFHQRGDCFVLPHKAEGFGIPLAEAMSFGKPTISTNYSGNLEFMNKDNSYLLDYQMAPVFGMIFQNYHGHMNWAEPSVGHLQKIMREVFTNRSVAKEKGEKGLQTIRDQLNADVIGQLMLRRLQEIQKKL